MEKQEYTVVYTTRDRAINAYRTGLKHGLITTPIYPPPEKDAQVRVVLELPFIGRTFSAEGAVVHSSDVATSIWLQDMPPELRRVILDLEEQPHATDASSADDDGPGDPASRPKGRVPPSAAQPNAAEPGDSRDDDSSRRFGFPVPGEPNRQVPGLLRFEGRFDTTSAYEVFLRVAAHKLTGVGVLTTEDARYWMYLLDGNPVQYRRSRPFHSVSIEALLVRKGLLPDKVLDEVRLIADVTGRSLISIVMRLGLVTEAALVRLRREQAQAVTEELLRTEKGSYGFFEFPTIRGVFRETPADLLGLLWERAQADLRAEGKSRRWGWKETIRGHIVVVTDTGEMVLDRLPLSDQERKLAEKCRAPGRPAKRLLRHTSLDSSSAMDTILALNKMDVLSLCSTDETNTDISDLERKVRERYGRLDQDHFQFLNLHWTALPLEMESRCDQIEKEVRAFEKHGAEITNFHTVQQQVMDRLAEIRRLTDNDDDRREYRKDLVGEAKLLMTAEQFIQQGEMADYRKDDGQTMDCFSRAAEVEPGGSGSHKRVKRARSVLKRLAKSKVPTT